MSAHFSRPARLHLDAAHRLLSLMFAALMIYGGWQAASLLRPGPAAAASTGPSVSLDLSASPSRLLLDKRFAQQSHRADRS